MQVHCAACLNVLIIQTEWLFVTDSGCSVFHLGAVNKWRWKTSGSLNGKSRFIYLLGCRNFVNVVERFPHRHLSAMIKKATCFSR